MMRTTIILLSGLLAAGTPAAATVSADWVAANAQPYISVQNVADLFNSNTLVNRDTQFTGVVGIQIRTNAQVAAGRASVCTGAVVGSNTVLTAGHCLTIDNSGIASVRVFFPDYNQPRQPSIIASAYYTNPDFDGNVLHGSDIGIIKLSQKVPLGTAIYALDHGSVASNLGVEEMVSLGSIGTGAAGDSGVQDGAKRYGFNEYEFTFAQVLAAAGLGVPPGSTVDISGAPLDGFLAYDFDSGVRRNDVFGRFLGAVGPGTLGYVDGVDRDTAATPGDSGAPHFQNGKIVGITSFGLSGALFQGGACGPGGVDPSFSATSCTDSSFGEIGVDTRVSAYYDYIAAHVPEPATWTMMIGGFGMVGATLRRRRTVAARAAAGNCLALVAVGTDQR